MAQTFIAPEGINPQALVNAFNDAMSSLLNNNILDFDFLAQDRLRNIGLTLVTQLTYDASGTSTMSSPYELQVFEGISKTQVVDDIQDFIDTNSGLFIAPPQIRFINNTASIGKPWLGCVVTSQDKGGGTDNWLASAVAQPGSEALAWADNVVANGGTVSTNTIFAVDGLVTSLQDAGIWSKLLRLNPIAGDQLAAAVVPLIDMAGVGNDTAVNYVDADYTELTGLTPDGSSKYLDTGLLCLSGGVQGGAIYTGADDLTSANSKWMGCQDASRFFGMGRQSSSRTECVIGAIPGRIIFNEPMAGAGLQHFEEMAEDNRILFRNGVQIAQNTTLDTEDTGPDLSILISASSDNGTPQFFNSTPVYGYAMDDGTFSMADAEEYYNCWAAFQAALGR